MGRRHFNERLGRRSAACLFRLTLASLVCLPLACALRAPSSKVCFLFEADEALNEYDEEAHDVTLYLYPLAAENDFQEMSMADLLAGELPKGGLAPPFPITIEPGERQPLEERVPQRTAAVGVMADFYLPPEARHAAPKGIVAAACGDETPTIRLRGRELSLPRTLRMALALRAGE